MFTYFSGFSVIKEDETSCEQQSGGSSNNNNNSIVDVRHNAMVANILQNKDLTVEVKPVRVKPVVLSPRHPDGNYLYHRRQQPQQSATSGNSVVVSVQPRQDRQVTISIT